MSTEATETETTPAAAPSTWRIKLKFLSIGLVTGLLVGGAGAGKIWYDGYVEREALTERLAHTEGVEALLGARAAVAAAAVELRRDNFGDAKQNLADARSQLSGLDPAAADLDAAKLDTITQRLNGINIASGSETAGPAGALDEVGLALDRLLQPPAAD